MYFFSQTLKPGYGPVAVFDTLVKGILSSHLVDVERTHSAYLKKLYLFWTACSVELNHAKQLRDWELSRAVNDSSELWHFALACSRVNYSNLLRETCCWNWSV